MKLLIEIGVGVNEGGEYGTALQVALQEVSKEDRYATNPPHPNYWDEREIRERKLRKKETFEILLGAGADISILDNSERNILNGVLQEFNIQLPSSNSRGRNLIERNFYSLF